MISNPTYYDTPSALPFPDSYISPEDWNSRLHQLASTSILHSVLLSYPFPTFLFVTRPDPLPSFLPYIRQSFLRLTSSLLFTQTFPAWQTVYGFGHLTPTGVFISNPSSLQLAFNSEECMRLLVERSMLKERGLSRMRGMRKEGMTRVRNDDRGTGVAGEQKAKIDSIIGTKWGGEVRSEICL